MEMGTVPGALGTLLLNLALGVLSLAGAAAVSYLRLAAEKLRAQTAGLKDEEARKVLDTALDDVQRLTELSVGAVEQTTAKALREAVKGGKADRKALLELSEQVFHEVKEKIAPEAQTVITRSLGSFDYYLSACIEDAVRRIKQADSA